MDMVQCRGTIGTECIPSGSMVLAACHYQRRITALVQGAQTDTFRAAATPIVWTPGSFARYRPERAVGMPLQAV